MTSQQPVLPFSITPQQTGTTHMGKSITLKKSLVSFPITANTKTETVTSSPGARHAHATNDFHYSAAVYDVEQNRLLRAGSLSYASHEWVMRNELAQ